MRSLPASGGGWGGVTLLGGGGRNLRELRARRLVTLGVRLPQLAHRRMRIAHYLPLSGSSKEREREREREREKERRQSSITQRKKKTQKV